MFLVVSILLFAIIHKYSFDPSIFVIIDIKKIFEKLGDKSGIGFDLLSFSYILESSSFAVKQISNQLVDTFLFILYIPIISVDIFEIIEEIVFYGKQISIQVLA